MCLRRTVLSSFQGKSTACFWGDLFLYVHVAMYLLENKLEKRKSEEIAMHLEWKVVGLVTVLPQGECPPGLAWPLGTLGPLVLQLMLAPANIYLVYWFYGLY